MSLTNLVIKMPVTEETGNSGIGNGNIETYNNIPMNSLAKEELQNSTDQKRQKTEAPVIVEFNEFYIDTNTLPDIAHLRQIFLEEIEYWDNYLDNDKKAVEFFMTGLEILNRESIRCLRISDNNTTGLCGVECKKSSPWNNLVNNIGVSDKPGNNSGSFGVGKDAAFACSQLRFVCYNTVSEDGTTAFKGRIKLPSYSKEDIYYTGFGYYCDSQVKSFMPIYENISLDPSYQRNNGEIGMDKFIIGFDETISNIKDEIVIASLNNYLVSFFEGKLIVKFRDLEISQKNLDVIISKYSDNPKLSYLTKEYYEVLKEEDSEKSKTYMMSFYDENDVEIKLVLNPSFSRRAAITRQTGMKVFDKGNLSGSVGFAGIVILRGNSVNKNFKLLENTEHDRWATDRINKYPDIKKKHDELFDFIRKQIKELHLQDYSVSMDADGVSDYLPFEYITGKRDKVETISNAIDNIRKKSRRKTKPIPNMNQQESVFVEDENGETIEVSAEEVMETVFSPDPLPNPPGPEPHPFDQTSSTAFIENSQGEAKKVANDKNKYKQINKNNISFKLIKKQTGYNLRVTFNKNVSSGFIKVSVSGEQSKAPVYITECYEDGRKVLTNDNAIEIKNIKSKSNHTYQFSISKDYGLALEVEGYENK
ncbi:MAG: hypothetical protein IJG49_04915 [Erysipelotrichaceae bacterium]|nr:hypothetical protein [Erysipelotrichaceae bacterium]MBQ6629677.1 hypothetical protein [Methanobrevibacter sp.]